MSEKFGGVEILSYLCIIKQTNKVKQQQTN